MHGRLKSLGILAVWLLLAAGLYFFFADRLHPNRAEKIGSGSEVMLQRDLSGHYRAEAFINGVKIAVLVDTGATDVAISPQLAQRLGIHSVAATRTQTANGETVAYLTRLASVRLGGIEATEVPATIIPNLGEDMLLGMSFLGRMDVRLYKGTMTIRQVSD